MKIQFSPQMVLRILNTCVLVLVLYLWSDQYEFLAFYCGLVEVLFLSCVVNF